MGESRVTAGRHDYIGHISDTLIVHITYLVQRSSRQPMLWLTVQLIRLAMTVTDTCSRHVCFLRAGIFNTLEVLHVMCYINLLTYLPYLLTYKRKNFETQLIILATTDCVNVSKPGHLAGCELGTSGATAALYRLRCF